MSGAGKSTTIGMLVGMVTPSSGTAFVRGRSLVDDLQAVRNMLGVCPQHDILFPELTAMQHLQVSRQD